MMSIRNHLFAAAAVVIGASVPAMAVPVELVFFVDYSGSNEGRRLDLAGQMESFLTALTDDPAIDSAKIAIMGSELTEPVLVQDMTDDVALLETAIVANLANGGASQDEDVLESVLAALPDQPSFLGITYNPDAVKSLVMLADEPDQSLESYQYYQDILAASEFLVNVIVPPRTFRRPEADQDFYQCSGPRGTLTANYSIPAVAKPEGAVFSICDFDENPVAFFEQFAATKISEFREEIGYSAVPLPAGGLLLLSAFGGLGLMRRRGAGA